MTSTADKSTIGTIKIALTIALLMASTSLAAQRKQQKLNSWGIVPANYSGITKIDEGLYAICDDKDKCDGFTLLRIEQNRKTGKITDIKHETPSKMAERRKEGKGQYRDCEGIAFCAERNTVFVSGEEDQRILEYTLNGEPTGKELNIPECFATQNRRTNYGFEALTYNNKTRTFWTTTESTLKQDGESASLQNLDVENVLRLQSFDIDLQPRQQFVYRMDRPTVRKSLGTYIHGVPSLLALDDGSLIVMEREEFVPRKYIGAFCCIKLYRIVPNQESESTVPNNLWSAQNHEVSTAKLSDIKPLEKEFLTEFTTYLRARKMNLANYEGMCLGQTLDDGRPTLLLIADSQGGQGNKLFHLKDYIKVLPLTYSKQ